MVVKTTMATVAAGAVVVKPATVQAVILTTMGMLPEPLLPRLMLLPQCRQEQPRPGGQQDRRLRCQRKQHQHQHTHQHPQKQ